MASKNSSAQQRLQEMAVHLEGEWTPAEAARVLAVFQRLAALSPAQSLPALFNGQPTTLLHSGRPGRVGRTRGAEICLDRDWTDWTLAHELGHRWNNAWGRSPQRELQGSLRAGRWEWLKAPLRRFEKWLERGLKKLGFQGRIDWQSLWYHPGDAPPPCGVDRNFNASEDLAECFAASVFPEDAKSRAGKAAMQLTRRPERWDWGKQGAAFNQTPRGQVTQAQIQQRFAAHGQVDRAADS